MGKFGGRKEWPVPTPQECLASCLGNAARAAAQREHWQKEYDRLPPGDPGVQVALYHISRATSDEKHWRSLAEHHRREMVAATCEGADGGPEPVQAAMVRPDGRQTFVETEVKSRTSRAPGEDDGDGDPTYDGWRQDVRRAG